MSPSPRQQPASARAAIRSVWQSTAFHSLSWRCWSFKMLHPLHSLLPPCTSNSAQAATSSAEAQHNLQSCSTWASTASLLLKFYRGWSEEPHEQQSLILSASERSLTPLNPKPFLAAAAAMSVQRPQLPPQLIPSPHDKEKSLLPRIAASSVTLFMYSIYIYIYIYIYRYVCVYIYTFFAFAAVERFQ